MARQVVSHQQLERLGIRLIYWRNIIVEAVLCTESQHKRVTLCYIAPMFELKTMMCFSRFLSVSMNCQSVALFCAAVFSFCSSFHSNEEKLNLSP